MDPKMFGGGGVWITEEPEAASFRTGSKGRGEAEDDLGEDVGMWRGLEVGDGKFQQIIII